MAEQKNLIGKEILTYRIESLIGRGGMGDVYLAANKHINQKVAIKVLNANLAESAIVRQKFVYEAETLLKLDHPNIVKFLNFYENEEGLFLIMEYVDGITLDDFITNKNGLIVEKRAYEMFSQILNAFAYAHKKGVIHRDIKPANIMLTNDNEGSFVAKVLDFGIAKIISESNDDEKGQIMGTPAYMSPEQVQGKNVDERSDIYSLGVLLHQMLTGQAPYNATTLSKTQIQNKVVTEPLPRMKEYYPNISDKMQKIVDKATAKEANDRYQNCNDFRKSLKKIFEPEKFPCIVKYAAAALIALLIACGYWFWDYNYHTKIYYYKDYVEQWGVPKGIGKADHRHREKTYKFEYKQGKLQHLALVNSKDNVVEDGESERFDRPVNADFEYSSDKEIAYVLYKDKNGKPLFRKRYNKKDGKINMFVFEYNDNNGTDKRLPKDLTGYKRLEDETAERGQISRFALEFDKNGSVRSLHYWNRDGNPAGDKEHIYGKRYERDKKGRVIKEYFLASNDSLTATTWGLGIKEFTYDDKDNMVKVAYLSPNGQPSLDDKDGTAMYVMEYDNYGNLTDAWYQSSDHSLMITQKQGMAGVKTVFNKNGEPIEVYHLGTDKEPMYCARDGFIGVKKEYDDYGFVKKQTYIDENGHPAVASGGSASVLITNDSKGNVLDISYYDINNQPFETTYGYFKSVFEYDSLGNQTSELYYDAKDSLCITTGGYAGMRYVFNDKDNLIEYTYYGVDNQPCDVNGIFTVKYEYDPRANETKRSFYAADGKTMVLNDSGIAGWESKYDDNGNKTEQVFFDMKNNPTLGNLGYASWTATYNSSGYMEELKNIDKNGQLIFVNSDGYAGIRYKYDERGNITEKYPYGTDGRLVKGKYIERYQYDSRDNQIETACYDENNNPVLGKNDYFRIVSKYDDRNQEIEQRYYNTNNRLFAPKTDNYAILKYGYDNRGNIVELACLNEFEKPVSKKEGYATHKSEYDAMGRIIRQTFYDENGQPTKPSVMVPEGLVEYDKWGNMNYLASADGYGKLIDNPHTGWTVKRWVYDIKRNLLEVAVYNKDNEPCIDKDEDAHKITYVYNKQNKKTEIRYYGTDNALRKSDFAIERCKYDEQGLLIELTLFNYLDKAMDYNNFFHKIVYTYDAERNPLYRKYYNVNNKLVQTTKYNKQTGEWLRVDAASFSAASSSTNSNSDNWLENWQKIADKCPFAVSTEVEIVSVTLSTNACAFTVRFIEISKYNISDSDLDNKKNEAQTLAQYLKKESKMPGNITLTLIAVDKAKRELFRITC